MSSRAGARRLSQLFVCSPIQPARYKSTVLPAESCPAMHQDHVTEAETKDFTIKDYSQVPGPRPIPFLGNTWRFIPYIGDYRIEEVDKVSMRLHRQYGDIVKISGLIGRPDMVFLYDADEIEKVFRNEELMPHRPSMPSLNYYKHKLRKDFFGDDAGVIAVHGDSWYKFRTKVQQPMLQPRVSRLYVQPISNTADEFVNRVREIRDSKLEVPADFLNEIHKWSLESIARVALDVRLGCLDGNKIQTETQELIDAVNIFFKNVGVLELKIPFWKLFNTPTWNKYINALDTITNISMKHISKKLEELTKDSKVEVNEKSSLVQRVLALDPSNPKIAAILALDMFLVGIDTTSAAVASILYQLSQNSEKQEKLREEIHRVFPNPSDEITHQKLEEMSYLRACIKETLRMRPVVIGNGRCMTQDTAICGYNIPKGVQVVFQHYVISNSTRYFSEPDQFLPERWLKNSKQNHHPFASLPFGYGRRMCVGRRFADLEIQTIITKMIQAFKIEYHHEELEYRIHPMYMPDGPLRFKCIDR